MSNPDIEPETDDEPEIVTADAETIEESPETAG